MYPIALIIVLYFYARLAIWSTRKAAARCKTNKSKWIARIAVALVFILGDVIRVNGFAGHDIEEIDGSSLDWRRAA